MSENYIVINGKKAELTEEQLEKLGIKPEKNKYIKMFDRRTGCGEVYFNINRTGDVNITTDIKSVDDDKMFKCANYCTNSDILHQRALHETLNRLLWRASVIAGELDNEWDGNGYGHKHWHIEMYADNREFDVDYFENIKYCADIFFPTRKSAEDAIENIVKPFMKEHPDFVW